MKKRFSTPKQLQEFRAEGYLKLPKFQSIDRINRLRHTIAEVTRAVAKNIGLAKEIRASDDEVIDHTLKKIYDTNPKAGGFVYDTIQFHANHIDLYDREKLYGMAAEVMGCDRDDIVEKFPLVILQTGGNNKHVNGWHQESGHYTKDLPVGTFDAVYFWIPLTAITPANGPLWIVPGSHRKGMLPHETNAFGVHREVEYDKKGEYYLDKKQFKLSNAIEVTGIKGDVFLSDINVVHKSGLNNSNVTRLIAIIRLGNFRGKGYIPQYGVTLKRR